MILTDHERECLEGLAHCHDHPRHPMKWARPLDIGGHNGSHHSNTLQRLTAKGWVNFRYRQGNEPLQGENGKRLFASRGSKRYRITDAGRAAIKSKGQDE